MATKPIHQQISDIIDRKLESPQLAEKVMRPIANYFKQRMQEKTKRGQEMTGEEFDRYAPSTTKEKGRSQPVTFRDTGAAMAGVQTNADGKEAEVVFTNKGEIMGYHQAEKGKGPPPNTPKRKIFPEPEDQEKGEMKQNIQFAERKFEEYLNE